MKKKLLVRCLIVFVVSFLFYWLKADITFDDIWNYGFSYNIAKGLIPYRDYNMVLTPFYPFVCSLFLKINSSLIMFYLFNSLVITLIYFLGYKAKGNSVAILIVFLLLNAPMGYNMFLLFLFVLLIYLENNDYSPFLIGVVASLAVLTKQSVLPFLAISLFLCSNKKDLKLRLLGFFIPFLMFLIYLLFTSSFYEFVDYCFLGLGNFGNENFNIASYPLLIVYITLNIYLVYRLFKSKFKEKELLYILSFQIIAFPIFDVPHLYFCILIGLFRFLGKFRLNLKSEIIFLVVIIIVTILNLIIGKDITSFDNKSTIFKGKLMYKSTDNLLYELTNQIDKYDYDKLYVFDACSYLIKINMNKEINKYDLINDGNMGEKGANGYIKEINETCKEKKCLFVLRDYKKSKFDQLSIEILDYVKNNYAKKEKVNTFEIYEN